MAQTIYTHYENYKGGINNRQIVEIIDSSGSTIKVFRSTKNKAERRAIAWLRKEGRLTF